MEATSAISSFDAKYRVKIRILSKQTNTSSSASYSQQRCQTHKKVEEKWNFCLILFFKYSDQFFVKKMVAENQNQTEQTSSAASFVEPDLNYILLLDKLDILSL